MVRRYSVGVMKDGPTVRVSGGVDLSAAPTRPGQRRSADSPLNRGEYRSTPNEPRLTCVLGPSSRTPPSWMAALQFGCFKPGASRIRRRRLSRFLGIIDRHWRQDVDDLATR